VNRTNIEWTEFTWNPVVGCKHGCDYCYAKRFAERGLGEYGEYEKGHRFQPRFLPERLEQPTKRQKPAKIFVVSMGDLFGEWVPDYWIEDILSVIKDCPQHIFQFLTKNPERYQEFEFPENCWLGASVENQDKANERIPKLLQTSNNNRFLSIEPILGRINLKLFKGHDIKFTRIENGQTVRVNKNLDTGARLKWIIIGAMTGPGAVKLEKEWVSGIIQQCRAVGIPIFLKDNLDWPEQIQEWPT
jgi:protein gp37